MAECMPETPPTQAAAQPLEEGRPRDWRVQAACRGADPDLFFPVSHTGLGRLQALAAKAICGGCPVRSPCARWALRNDEPYGIWGGLDEADRRAVRRAGAEDSPGRAAG